MNVASETLYHVTALSNFARGFDKYTRQYRKSAIPESTYPNEWYLLRYRELGVGIAKASKLRQKLGIPGDELLVLRAAASPSVSPNSAQWRRSGLAISGPTDLRRVSCLFRRATRGGIEPRRGDGEIARSQCCSLHPVRQAAAANALVLAHRSWMPSCLPVLFL